jgi:hypothetical protein
VDVIDSTSSGCTPSCQLAPISSSRLVPVKRIQPSFTNVTSPSSSVVHIIAGAVLARSRKLASDSRSASSVERRSWMSVAVPT